MQKRKQGKKLSRESSQRKALMKAQVAALILHEKIKTTEAKAKEISRFSEKLITLAKKGDLSSRRRLAGFFPAKLVKKMIEEVALRYKDRQGGYTRIIKLGPRPSDGAKIAIIELVK